MIKCDRGATEFKGTLENIAAELECIIEAFLEVFYKRIGKEGTEKFLNRIIEDAKLSVKEIDSGCSDNNLKKALDYLLDEIMKL